MCHSRGGAHTVYGLSQDEWTELGLAFAYGQRPTKEDLEDIREFRQSYRRLLEAEGADDAGEAEQSRGD